jgi:nucleoside 2-deoxyribosyltransferase
MKVFVAGSRKFVKEFGIAMKKFKEFEISATHGEKNISASEDTAETVKSDNERMFRKIDESDIVFVIAKDGYVGYSVSMELGYAYAKRKKIISSEEIKELAVRNLVSKVMSLEDLIEYLKR